MPLLSAQAGETNRIKKVIGKEETRLFLEKLGFVAGAAITVVSSTVACCDRQEYGEGNPDLVFEFF